MRSGRSEAGERDRSRGWRLAGVVAAGIVALMALLFGITRSTGERAIGYTELVTLADRGEPRAVHVEGERFVVTRGTGERLAAVVDDPGARHALIDRFVAAGVPLDFDA